MRRKIEKKKKKGSPSVSELEADVAYFDARLSLLGKPVTQYQKAQFTAYRLLEGLLIEDLVRTRSGALKKSSDKSKNKK